MGTVAGNLGEYILGSLNDSTGWIPLDGIISDIAINITGTFNGTIAMQISNETDYVKTRYSTIATYTATQGSLGIPHEIGRYVRFIMTIYASGSAYVGFSKGIDPNGQLVDMTPQGNSTAGVGTFV